MKAMKALLENYWIIREKDKQLYYDVKREVNDKEVKKFLTEMLGWKLIHTERVIKLEKLPSHACAFTGIYRNQRLLFSMCNIDVFRG